MAAVAATPTRTPGHCWRFRHDVQATLEQMLGAGLPENLFLAKARKLGLKQKLEGCTRCTCRGDYHLPRECRLYRCCYDGGFDWTTHPEYDPSWEGDVLPPRPSPIEAFNEVLADVSRQLGLA